MFLHVTDAKHVEGHRVHVWFNDGTDSEIDLSESLVGPVNPNWANVGFGSYVINHVWFYIGSLILTFAAGIIWSEAERVAYKKGKSWWRHSYVKGILYLGGSLVALSFMPVILDVVSELTGLSEYIRTYPRPDEVPGLGVFATLLVFLALLSLCLFLIYEGFTDTSDEIPLELLESN